MVVRCGPVVGRVGRLADVLTDVLNRARRLALDARLAVCSERPALRLAGRHELGRGSEVKCDAISSRG